MYYIGIDLGGTNIAVGLVDENDNIIHRRTTPTCVNDGADRITQRIARLCLELALCVGDSINCVESVGIATPGTANSDTGIIDYANNIPFFHYPIVEKIKKLLNFDKVYLENDANAAALGEAVAGAARNTASSVMITLGTGVGGGIIIDGKPYAGFNFAGAELGHTVMVYGGRECTCGRRGCFETYCSATGLIKSTKEKMAEDKRSLMWKIYRKYNKYNAKIAFEAAREKDKSAVEVVEQFIDYLACGITNIINIFQPEVLCIGGGISGEGDTLLEPLKAKIAKEVYSKNSEKQTEIKIALLKNDAGIIGAANLGRK